MTRSKTPFAASSTSTSTAPSGHPPRRCPRWRQGGRIILTASIWSRIAVAEFSAYVASKHANLGFMRAMAHELGPRGHPRECRLPRLGPHRSGDAVAGQHVPEHRAQSRPICLAEITGAQVLPGLLEPDDMAPLYLFLASDGGARHHRAGHDAGPRRGDGMRPGS